MDLFERSSFSEIRPEVLDAFLTFHKENPRVYELIKQFAFELWNAGVRHYGIGALTERVRWHVALETKGDDFKINNNWRSGYVRLLILDFPQFQTFFHTRKSKAAA